MCTDASKYSNTIARAAMRHCIEEGGVYRGKQGALRLAREYGRGLVDFPMQVAQEELSASYSSVCVIAYNLKPPIDAKDWITEIQRSWNEVHTYHTEHGEVTEQYCARWFK